MNIVFFETCNASHVILFLCQFMSNWVQSKFGRDHKGRAIRYIFCSAIASQKDAAAIPHAINLQI